MTVVCNEHLDRRAKAKSYYDKTARKELTLLVPGQFAYSKPNDHHRSERWNFGEVLNKVTLRSYLIKTQDGLVRRNRTHRRPSDAPLSCNQQPLTQAVRAVVQREVPAVVQQEVSSSDSPVVIPPTLVEAVPTTDRSVGSTPSPVESLMQKSCYGQLIRPLQRLDL